MYKKKVYLTLLFNFIAILDLFAADKGKKEMTPAEARAFWKNMERTSSSSTPEKIVSPSKVAAKTKTPILAKVVDVASKNIEVTPKSASSTTSSSTLSSIPLPSSSSSSYSSISLPSSSFSSSSGISKLDKDRFHMHQKMHEATALPVDILSVITSYIRTPAEREIDDKLIDGFKSNNPDLIKEAIKNGADINMPIDSQNNTPLIQSIIKAVLNPLNLKKYIEIINMLLDNKNLNIFKHNKSGLNALSYAPLNDKILDLFLNHAIGPNEIAASDNSTLFQKALISSSPSMIQKLIDLGADINLSAPFGSNVLHFAASNPNAEVLKILLKNIEIGKFINEVNKWEQTPIFIAVNNPNIAVLQTLIENGANVNILTSYDLTPLISATAKDFPEHVKLLLENDANTEIGKRISEHEIISQTFDQMINGSGITLIPVTNLDPAEIVHAKKVQKMLEEPKKEKEDKK